MKGSLSANQQTQENNGPVSRVPACLVPRVQAQCCLTQSLPTDDGRKIVWGLGFKAQIFSCALLRMLKTIFTLETENVLSRKLYKYFHYAGKYFSNNLLKRRNFPLSGSSVVWCCAVERYCCWVVSTAQRTSPRPGPSEYVWVMAGPITPRWTLDIPSLLGFLNFLILYRINNTHSISSLSALLEISQLRSLWKWPTNHQLPLKASVPIASGDNLLKCPFMRKSVQKVLNS